MEEPGPGSLSARCSAPRLSLPARSDAAGSSREHSARSPCYDTDRPPPKSRLPRFTRQPGANGVCPTASGPQKRDEPPPSRRKDAGVPRCLSMPPARSAQRPTDSHPPSRLGTSFGAGSSTASSGAQHRRTSQSHNGGPRRTTAASSQGNLVPPVPSRMAATRPKQPVTNSARNVRTREPSLRSQTRPSHKPTGHSAPLPSPTPHRPPRSQLDIQPHSTRDYPTPPNHIPSPETPADRSQGGASRADADTAVPTAAPVVELDLTLSRGQDDGLLPLGEEELDVDLDEELRAMSFLSTAGPHAHSARSPKLGTPSHDFSLSPSPMSSAMSRMRHAAKGSPTVHQATHNAVLPAPHPFANGPCMEQYDYGSAVATNTTTNRNQLSAARQIDFAAALPGSEWRPPASPTPSTHEHSCSTGHMRSSAPPAYLGGVSLLAVGDPSDSEDFGFGGLGFEDSTPSLSNEGRTPCTRSCQTTRAPSVQVPPVAATPAQIARPPQEATSAALADPSPASMSAESSCTPLAQVPVPQITSADLLEASANMIGTHSRLRLHQVQFCPVWCVSM